VPNSHRRENLFSSSLISTRRVYQRPRNGGSTARVLAPKRARNHRVRNKFDDIPSRHGHHDFGAPVLQDRSCERASLPNLMGPYASKHQSAKFAATAVHSRQRAQRRDAGRATSSMLVNRLLHLRTSREPNTAKKGFCPAIMTSDGRSFCYRQPDLYCTMIDRSARERTG
jgi:hypothetical protein